MIIMDDAELDALYRNELRERLHPKYRPGSRAHLEHQIRSEIPVGIDFRFEWLRSESVPVGSLVIRVVEHEPEIPRTFVRTRLQTFLRYWGFG